MKKLTYKQIRAKYVDFMRRKDHTEIANISLVPENDPSVLYVTAGMFPLVPFLLGEKHPAGERLTNVQRCVRTDDIEEVGDGTHFTAFEMIGAWSLNDYFKKEALENWWEFVVEEMEIDINRLYATVFAGNNFAPRDDESVQILKGIYAKYGVTANDGKGERIQYYGVEDNWWGLADGGPCGPTSELFYDSGKEPCGKDCHINCDCGKYIELGNNVFMEYLLKDGKYSPLGRHNVDFGGGLERLTSVIQGVKSNYDIDIYKPILDKVNELAKQSSTKSSRIVVDHLKSAAFIVMDGVVPGRSQQEYILRRLIRRAIRQGKLLGIEGLFTAEIVSVCIDQFADLYPQMDEDRENITKIIEDEEKKFAQTLRSGLKIIEKYIEDGLDNNIGSTAFKLYETYGIPIEMFVEELESAEIKFDKDDLKKQFEMKKKEHQELSRTAAKGLFKGGLADTTDISKKYHTATHLLLAALRKIVGEHIYQRGSNITTERLRFDFPADEKLSPKTLQAVEDEINAQIKKDLPVNYKEMEKDEALKLVPFAAFDDKYGETVKVYYIGDEVDPYSIELCNGPHVDSTGEIGGIKIVKQENVGAGVKRIKAVVN